MPVCFPSDAVTIGEYVPAVPGAIVPEITPAALMVRPGGSPVALNVTGSLSGSVAVTVSGEMGKVSLPV